LSDGDGQHQRCAIVRARGVRRWSEDTVRFNPCALRTGVVRRQAVSPRAGLANRRERITTPSSGAHTPRWRLESRAQPSLARIDRPRPPPEARTHQSFGCSVSRRASNESDRGSG
jgi:hypothetical protein